MNIQKPQKILTENLTKIENLLDEIKDTEEFKNCNFSNTSFDNCSFIRCEFYNCKMTGCDIIESRLYNINFIETNMNYANLSMSSFENVIFNDVGLRNSNLLGED